VGSAEAVTAMRTHRAIAIALAMAAILPAACRRAENAAEQAALAAEDRERTVLLERDEKELQNAMTAVRNAAAVQRTEATLYHVANEFDGDYAAIAAQRKETVAGYPIRRQIRVTGKQLAPLAEMLTKRNTFFPAGDAWACIFEPHHVLKLRTGNSDILAVICIKCGDFEFSVAGDSIGTRSVTPAANAELARVLNDLLSGAS